MLSILFGPTTKEALKNEGSLSISLYVPMALAGTQEKDTVSIPERYDRWKTNSAYTHSTIDRVVDLLGAKENES